MEQDFKYVMQDFSNIYIGARITFEELTQKEDTPGRLNSAIYMYMFKDDLQNVRICDHLLTVEENTMPYMVYKQLKAQMKVVTPITKTDKKGNEITEYKTQTMSVEDFVKDNSLRNSIKAEQITEVTAKKLNLFALSV